jgi:hypothetical protein
MQKFKHRDDKKVLRKFKKQVMYAKDRREMEYSYKSWQLPSTKTINIIDVYSYD